VLIPAYFAIKRVSWKDTLPLQSEVPKNRIEIIIKKHFDWCKARELLNNYEQYLDFSKNKAFYPLYINTVLVGFAALKPMSDEDIELYSMDIKREYRGQGYGSLLLAICLKKIEATGFKNVHVWFFSENFEAEQFYTKRGFSIIEDDLWNIEEDTTVKLKHAKLNLDDPKRHRIQFCEPPDLQISA
jgi:N-acetylglutamate synthase-like GNAT family acetyltransferase